MKNLIEFSPILLLILFVLYFITLIILRFVMKIKKDYKLEQKIKANPSKSIKYLYLSLFLFFIIISLILKKSFNLILMILFLDSLITSIQALKIVKDKKQKYYYIASIIFHPLAITALLLS